MKSLIIVNPADCIGCRTCEVACVVAHPSEQELNADVFTPVVHSDWTTSVRR